VSIFAHSDNSHWESESDGIFDIQMALYSNSSFTHLQPSEFNINVADLLFAQIELKKAPKHYVVQLDKCWATPE
jgi:hypothetical protein